MLIELLQFCLFLAGALAFAPWFIAYLVISFSCPKKYWGQAFILFGLAWGIAFGTVLALPDLHPAVIAAGTFACALPLSILTTGGALLQRWRLKTGRWF